MPDNQEQSLSKYCKDSNFDLSFAHCFGVHGPIRDNVLIVEKINSVGESSDYLIFPVGVHIVQLHINKGGLFFFEGKRNGVQAVTAMALSPNHKYLAVCDLLRESTKVSIFGVISKRQIRGSLTHQILKLGGGGGNKIMSVGFSGDSKHLVAASRDLLVVWSWEKEKIVFTSALSGGEVTRVRCPFFSTALNPFLSTSGLRHFRIWAPASHENFKQSMVMASQSKEQQNNFVDHVWLVDKEDKIQRVAVVAETIKGKTNHGDWRVVIYQLAEEQTQRPKLEEQQMISLLSLKETIFLTISSFSSKLGFCVGGSNGYAFIYEKLHDKQGDPSFSLTNTCQGDQESFSSICPALDDDHMVLFSNTKRIVSWPLNSTDSSGSSDNNDFCDLIPRGHHGPILDMDQAVQRPIFATCGSDKTVRIWDYASLRCDIIHVFRHEDPTAIALHPSGYQLLVGSKDRICLYNILVQEISFFREMNNCKSCRRLRFCHGGHLFAAALGTNISVYSTYQNNEGSSFQLLRTFSGHVGPVNALSFNLNDVVVYSTGTDGNVYNWDIISGCRSDGMNVLHRSTSYTALVVDDRNLTAAILSSDGMLFVISWRDSPKESPTARQLPGTGSHLDKITAICLSINHKNLFAGTAGGCIRMYDWPIKSDKPQYQEYSSHMSANNAPVMGHSLGGPGCIGITSIQVTRFCVITTGEDGSIFLSRMQTLTERSLGMEGVIDPDYRSLNNSVILVSSDDYNEQKEQILDLERRIDTLKVSHEFDLHSKDTMWQGAMKDLSEKSDELIGGERIRFEELQQKHEETIQRHVKDLEIKDKTHLSTVHELENQYEHRLAVEMKSCDQLLHKMESLQATCEKSLKDQETSYEKKIWVIGQVNEKEGKKLNATIARMREDAAEAQRIFRETLDQQEEEYEMELMQLSAAAEGKIHSEHNKIKKMQGVVQSLSSRRDQLDRQSHDLKTRNQSWEETLKIHLKRGQELEHELVEAKCILKERAHDLRLKDAAIKELKSEANKSANIKYFLENQVQELQVEREPIIENIDALKRNILCLNTTHEREMKISADKELDLEKNNLKMKAQEREISALKQTLRHRERDLLAIISEFASLVEVDNSKHLHEAVKQAYRKHVKGDAIKKTSRKVRR